MQRGGIDWAVVGADRIAANGDTANKIGTYSVAVNCHYHSIPFYIAAPLSTFDFTMETGAGIPVEERSPDEIRSVRGQQVTPIDAPVFNPSFDVTPASLITGIITEKGVLRPLTGSQFGLCVAVEHIVVDTRGCFRWEINPSQCCQGV